MKLTLKQIEEAFDEICGYEDGPEVVGCKTVETIDEALDAYQRVEALLEQWHVGHDTCAWQGSMGPLYDELRHALYGE